MNAPKAMFDLSGKTALVTGAASGIGAAIAEFLARAGARVVVADRDAVAGRQKAASLGGIFVEVDVSSPESCRQAYATVGEVEVLVNVAGIGHVGSLLQTSEADLDRLYAVNVRGILSMCREFVPGMLARGVGSVINMASIAGVVAVRDRLAYTTTKFAVVGLTKALALDHSHTGVRFNCICPGRVETPFVAARLREYADPQAALRELSSTQLNGRMIRPEEVAGAALYLAADESAMVTGSAFMIDGGWSAGK